MTRLSKLGTESNSSSLLFTLVDTVTNDVFPVLEAFGDRMEELERNILLDPTAKNIQQVSIFFRDCV